MEVEPRRREHVGRRGYSPRRTQSSSNRVEMYFSEVDVDVRQPRPREPVVSLTNIRSSEDISSGYSSGEALQTHRTIPQGDSLIRTSSVGARTRAKPRSTTKKTPEDKGEDPTCVDLPSLKNTTFPLPFSLVTPERAVELLLLLSQDSNICDYVKFDRELSVADDINVDSTDRSAAIQGTDDQKRFDVSAEKPQSTDLILLPECLQAKTRRSTESSTDGSTDRFESKEEKREKISVANDNCDEKPAMRVEASPAERTDEFCEEKFEELKRLLTDARNAVTNIVSSQETPMKGGGGSDSESSSGRSMQSACAEDVKPVDKRAAEGEDNAIISEIWSTPNISRSNSESTNRAGRYKKKPAPKVPTSESQETLIESEPENALKATLVIKTGSLKTFTNADATKNVFLTRSTDVTKSKEKKSRRQRTKEGFSKLLTIPKNIFHNTFHRDQNDRGEEEDSISEGGRRYSSRSGSSTSREISAGGLARPAVEAATTNCGAGDVNARNGQGLDKAVDREGEPPRSILEPQDQTDADDRDKPQTGKNSERDESIGVEPQVGHRAQLRKDTAEMVTDIY